MAARQSQLELRLSGDVEITDACVTERRPWFPVGLIRPRLRGGHHATGGRIYAVSRQRSQARRRGTKRPTEGSMEILAATYVQLADQSKKIDDTGTKSKGALQGL